MQALGPRARQALGLVGALLVVVLLWWSPGGDSVPDRVPEAPGTTQVDGSVATIAFADLPAEAQATIALIESGGPYPYRQDGARFGNREQLLPLRGADHYREFTVPTPGSRDRGARRIVLGSTGEMYYTEDHYRSFSRIDLRTRE